ncbi:putative telomere length regulation protein [Chloropicon primus]|uniref:Putative telomere length regulation protein n=2 Tax=Chloropicon primus TaxID=1764295 RepID=A0A5B8MFU5_9CHLO|nr:putative telomere length regulation protein [Chloropicon primus]|eukprot:QDZ19279.1 putative telomere length regulation protein [Chloropicon primus]
MVEDIPAAMVEHKVARLVHLLGKEVSSCRNVARLKELLRIARRLNSGRLRPEDPDLQDWPDLDEATRELPGGGDSWHAAFMRKRLGLYLCLGEVLLSFVGPNWLALFSTEEKEELFYSYFDSGPKVQLLKFLVGKSTRGPSEQAESRSGELAHEVVKISREAAKSILERLFVHGDGVEILLAELDCCARKDAKEVAALVASIPDRTDAQEQCVATLLSKTLRASSKRVVRDAERNEETVFVYLATLIKGFCRRGFAHMVAQAAHAYASRLEQGDLSQKYVATILWDKSMPHMKDLYAMEHLFHSLLLLESEGDTKARETPRTLRLCFGNSLGASSDLKIVLLDRILLKRALPLGYLRLVLGFLSQGASDTEKRGGIGHLSVEELIYRTSVMWSKEESSGVLPLGHQASLSTIIIEGLKLTDKDKLEGEYPSVPEILKGISSRLSNVNVSIRSHGMAVAKALSFTLDPNRPLEFDSSVDFEQSLREDLARATKHESSKGADEVVEKYTDKIEGESHTKDINAAVSYGTVCLIEECEVLALSDESSSESDSDDESSLEAYDMSDDDVDVNAKLPSTLGSFIKALRKSDDHERFEFVLMHCERLISQLDSSVTSYLNDLTNALLYANIPEEFMKEDVREGLTPLECKLKGIIALLVKAPVETSGILINNFYSVHLGVSQRLMILDALKESALQLSGSGPAEGSSRSSPRADSIEEKAPGLSEETGGKTRIFAPISLSRKESPQYALVGNEFAQVAHAFMLPLLSKYDHKGEGLDMVERDFVLLGKILQTSYTFLACAGATQQAIELGFLLFEFVEGTRVLYHREAFVRKSAVQAVRGVLSSVPSFLIGTYDDGSALNYERLHDVLISLAKHDSDEECRILAAQGLHELEQMYNKVLPKIEVL